MRKYQVDDIYFMIWYSDEHRLYPYFETVVFLGKNIEDGRKDHDVWYFQDLESYWQAGAYPRSPHGRIQELRVYRLGYEDLGLVTEGPGRVVDADGLIVELSEWRSRVDSAKQTNSWPTRREVSE
jgi:hypothetical protein